MDAFFPLLVRQANNATTDAATSTEDPLAFCINVNPNCPVEGTIYGYYPNLGGNAFFIALFALLTLCNAGLGLKSRTWTYLIALFFGSLGEALGYVGRVMLHDNPWDGNGFNIQICCLIIAPAFIAAGVYLTLKVCSRATPPSTSLSPFLVS